MRQDFNNWVRKIDAIYTDMSPREAQPQLVQEFDQRQMISRISKTNKQSPTDAFENPSYTLVVPTSCSQAADNGNVSYYSDPPPSYSEAINDKFGNSESHRDKQQKPLVGLRDNNCSQNCEESKGFVQYTNTSTNEEIQKSKLSNCQRYVNIDGNGDDSDDANNEKVHIVNANDEDSQSTDDSGNTVISADGSCGGRVFVLPQPHLEHDTKQCLADPLCVSHTSAQDLNILRENENMLSQCGYYYKDMSSKEAKKALHKHSVGQFLLRDSSDPDHLQSLSVKTSRGTTSVRIKYEQGNFSIDCESSLRDVVPKFQYVLELVDYLVKLSQAQPGRCSWLERSGRKREPVKLVSPLLKAVPSLQHTCRTKINSNTPREKIVDLALPQTLINYVKNYSGSH